MTAKLALRSWVCAVAVVVLSLAGFVAPGTARAGLESPVSVDEIWGSFVGTFSVTSFTSDQSGNLVTDGTVSGTLYDPLFQVSGTLDEFPVSPRPVYSVAATCESLEVVFEPSAISFDNRAAVWGGSISVSTSGKSPMLCKVSRLFAKNASSAQIAATLNKFLSREGR